MATTPRHPEDYPTMIRTSTLLGAAIALALHGAAATAQTPKAAAAQPPATVSAKTASDAPTAAARRDVDRAAKRCAELTGHAGDDERVHVFERRIGGRPVIGVLLASDAQAGVRVTGVTPESGAAKAGLKPGDRITSV